MRLTVSIAVDGATDDDLELLRKLLFVTTKSGSMYAHLDRSGNAGIHVRDLEADRTVTINATKEDR